MSGSRERILGRVKEALAGRPASEYPGAFPGDPATNRGESALEAEGDDERSRRVNRFREMMETAGAEVKTFNGVEEARAWLEAFVEGFSSGVYGRTVPESLRIPLEEREPAAAELGVSMARCAVAETGSLILDARDGRRSQLLPPTQVVWVWSRTIHGSALEFLRELNTEPLPSAVGLHSGPSKSADIGQIMVRGIHGPGRLIAGILEGLQDPGPA
ncbi:MAG: LUD domain-containing protein [Gemmatimonadetes bacterium]|nr:lactate utilization protein [Gemmatimonadota bacterium]NNM04353.1 LUD domain-containing protein [Gemmatimonadota bacterium]